MQHLVSRQPPCDVVTQWINLADTITTYFFRIARALSGTGARSRWTTDDGRPTACTVCWGIPQRENQFQLTNIRAFRHLFSLMTQCQPRINNDERNKNRSVFLKLYFYGNNRQMPSWTSVRHQSILYTVVHNIRLFLRGCYSYIWWRRKAIKLNWNKTVILCVTTFKSS